MGSVFRKPKPPAPPPTPTRPEVSQATATSATSATSKSDMARGKGRSNTILTGPKGVKDEYLTLGKKSLLGK